ncbi:hypothetical protein BWQ96_04029 [Gracilariopsis chorda]|uniref:SAP domain-containing protein n=1 Tax=Gracilariopsis chorda TaxID=448386 RepID=A0A2V3IVJ7_9FLOR|nr:hypothetical protein BWQ96_04029 [Gracilariopsis chorda]|eukprot:PXF46152.1 hypothetical protein BWQ96_04029 [Gracilariopsis chorda]
MFKSSKFTLVPKAGCQHLISNADLEQFHRVYERQEGTYGLYLARYKVGQVVSEVFEVIALQSQDPGWFLARAFQFTSQTTSNFIRARAHNFEINVRALADIVKGKSTGYGNSHFPDTTIESLTRLELRLKNVCEVLNVSLSTAPSENEFDQMKTFLVSAETNALNAMTKAELVAAMSRIGHPVSSTLRRAQIVEKILLFQQQVQTGEVVMVENEAEELSAEEQVIAAKKKITGGSLQALIGFMGYETISEYRWYERRII